MVKSTLAQRDQLDALILAENALGEKKSAPTPADASGQ
jgi:hypothetical protein